MFGSLVRFCDVPFHFVCYTDDGRDISSCDSDTNWKREKVDNHVLYYNDNGEKTEPRLDTNIEDYLDNGEEFAYLFEDNQWVCYDLHYDTPMDVPIPV